MADKSNDPAVMWQNFLGEVQKGISSFANQTMGSGEFSRAMSQLTGTSMGAQKALGDVMERYFVGMNLPSRAQIENVGERLQAIEGIERNQGGASSGPPQFRGVGPAVYWSSQTAKRPPSAVKGEQK